MIKEKVINYPYLTEVGVAKDLRVTIWGHKSKFPIGIIVFDVYGLSVNVIQCLYLLTASLIYF